ncbi:MAG: hypothetical protein K2N18_03525, partial [Clostridia bacterium]|nr:hypothetical protein [Clostridia bacterium]
LNSFKRGNAASKADLLEMKSFIFEEIDALTNLIPTAPNYKAKDEMFYYEDKLVGLYMFVCANKVETSEDEIGKIKALVKTVEEYQVLETAVSDMYGLEKINAEDAKKVVDIAASIPDEYQKGLLFQGLLSYEKSVGKFTAEAKTVIADYVSSEMERYLDKDGLTEDEINNLEIVADVCKHFINDKTIALLQRILNLKHNNISYYTVATLISCKQTVNSEVIADLARDLVYADLTYDLVKKNNLTELFPKEFASAEYLAKSDLVHWLTYPTELGKTPDEIVLMGDVKIKGEQYYVFKYKSDSDNLSDDLRNEWLIGWSSADGGTFSDFDRLSDYEQKKPEKTLKVIKKKLIGK